MAKTLTHSDQRRTVPGSSQLFSVVPKGARPGPTEADGNRTGCVNSHVQGLRLLPAERDARNDAPIGPRADLAGLIDSLLHVLQDDFGFTNQQLAAVAQAADRVHPNCGPTS